MLMSMLVEGIMEGDLPWNLIFIGMATAAMVELFGIGSLPFAVGLYLPIHLTMPIMLGGLIKAVTGKLTKDKERLKDKNERGILLSSGFIAGEALIAIAVSLGVVFPEETFLGSIGSAIAFSIVAIILFWIANRKTVS